MLKITEQSEGGIKSVVLEGKLAGPWVNELEQCWRRAAPADASGRVRVDLCAVTFIDEAGKALLKKMYRAGAELIATGCFNQCICEAIISEEQGRARSPKGA